MWFLQNFALSWFLRNFIGTPLVAQWLRLPIQGRRCRFSPWSGNKTPHAIWCGQKNKSCFIFK